VREIAILLGSAALLPAANADLILHNGKVVTVDSHFTIQQAVAIRSGAITAVGPRCLSWWTRMFTRSKPA
jgi:hypothetical protein